MKPPTNKPTKTIEQVKQRFKRAKREYKKLQGKPFVKKNLTPWSIIRVPKFFNKRLNEALEGLAKQEDLTLYELRIYLVILRQTVGWGKHHDVISYTQFQKASGIDRRNIGRTLKSLQEKNYIGIDRISPMKIVYSVTSVVSPDNS
ncbi:MAG: replication protein [Deltaproteobacteria bacterium]|nr:replication protein [Deltaproteobacteria bacterium]